MQSFIHYFKLLFALIKLSLKGYVLRFLLFQCKLKCARSKKMLEKAEHGVYP